MRKLALYFLLCLPLPFLCFHSSAQNVGDIPQPNRQQLSYRILEGTIGEDLAVRMVLDIDNEVASGHYFYKSRRLPILLHGSVSWEGMELAEYPNVWFRDEDSTGKFAGKITYQDQETAESMTFEGTWTPKGNTKGKPLPFRLTETLPEGSVGADMYSFGVSWSRTRNDVAIERSTESSFPQLIGKTPGIDRINAYIREHVGNFPQFRDDEALDNEVRAADVFDPEAAPDLRRLEQLIDVTPAQPGGDDWWFEYGNVEHFHETIRIRYNERQLVTIEFGGDAYTGGAHSNQWSHHITFDVATGQPVQLTDILKPGFEEPLARAGEAALRKKWDLKPDAPLSEGLTFEDKIELNGDWYFTDDHSIGFSYDPYEIGSYAAGFISFDLPREAVAPWVVPGSVFERAATR